MPNRHSTLNSLFTDIATAIRNKKGESSSTTYKADDFDTAIAALNVDKYKEISTQSEMDATLVAANEGKIYKYTGTTGNYINGRLYLVKSGPFTGLCFTANAAESTVTLNQNGSPAWTGSYSIDGSTWVEYVPGTTGAITLTNVGDKVYFKGDIEANYGNSNYIQFSMTGSIAASGNCNSIYSSYNFENLTILSTSFCFYKLFMSCTSLTTPPELPATTLSGGCYMFMFTGCTSLTTAPSLPATTLSNSCYDSMFQNCTSLTTSPKLPAITLADSCYYSMFAGCTALTTPPILRSNTLYEECYRRMFSSCTSLQVNDYKVSGTAEQAWRIPICGTFTSTSYQSDVFYNCAGTRTYNSIPGSAGNSYTYYTQNQPI